MRADAAQPTRAQTTAPRAPYDPRFDPLLEPTPGGGRDYAPTWWVASAGAPPEDDGPIAGDLDCDVAIVGSGSTGISTALALARDHGVRAVVLEANRASWGCSSRSGGQGQNASGRLKRSQWIARWGLATAKALDAEIRAGFEYFRALARSIECDAVDGGHLYVAHRPARIAGLQSECELMRDTFGYAARMLTADEVRRDYCDDREAAGALFEPDGVGVHPLKLTFGLLRAARAAGARVHPASPVERWTRDGDRQLLHTPGGVVRARRVAICTGGYTSQSLTPLVRNKLMPILSNSLVTRPLTAAELAATNFRSQTFLTDTRVLRFYYRLLPDGDRFRLQIGSRSAVTGAAAEDSVHLKLLTDAIARKFPPLAGIDVDHSWWGWVDVSHDMMPRIVQPEPSQPVWYALGYGGNGVSFSTWAGKRLAERIVGKDVGNDVFRLPIYDSPLEYPNLMGALRSELFAPFRRLGQHVLYRWYWLRDEKF